MRDTARTPRDEPKHGRAADDEARAEDTWYEECARRPVDDPLIATIPLPDGQCGAGGRAASRLPAR
jgi:hypothetical protein